MTCEELRTLSVSDDPDERRRFLHHAAGCPECARIRDAHEHLGDAVERWRRATPSPPAALRARVRRAVLHEDAGRGEPARPWWRPGPGRVLPLAAAAILLVAVGVVLLRPSGPAAVSTGGRLLLNDALAAARDAERQHARAIAELERLAEDVLARADDPDVPPREAALLMSYRHRLHSLDATIAEIRDYLDDNPGLPGARAVLLAAYTDKTDVLRELLARSEETDA